MRELGGNSLANGGPEGADAGNPPIAAPRGAPPLSEGQVAVDVFPGATFECLSCGSRFFGGELAKLPEPTCSNCGYRIFRKVRGRVAKTLKGE